MLHNTLIREKNTLCDMGDLDMLKKLVADKKAFTLVELIVVLIILAILMAVLLPSLTGYIAEARNSTSLTEARTAYITLQTVATMEVTNSGASYFTSGRTALSDAGRVKFNSLVGQAGWGEKITGLTMDSNYTILTFGYSSSSGGTVRYENGQFAAG